MWSLLVVVLCPGRNHHTGVVQAQEQGLVEQLVAHATVEALGVAILHRLARGNVVPLHADLAAPGKDGVRRQLDTRKNRLRKASVVMMSQRPMCRVPYLAVDGHRIGHFMPIWGLQGRLML